MTYCWDGSEERPISRADIGNRLISATFFENSLQAFYVSILTVLFRISLQDFYVTISDTYFGFLYKICVSIYSHTPLAEHKLRPGMSPWVQSSKFMLLNIRVVPSMGDSDLITR